MAQPGLVIFDCDGVLVDSEPLTNQVLRDSLASYGLELPLHEVMQLFVGGTMAGVMKQARALGADLPDHWLGEIYAQAYAVLAEKVQIIPGVDAVLDALDELGVAYAVGSNGPMRKMEITLGKTGLSDRFHGRVFSAQDCAAPKPAPDVYLKAAAFAGAEPARCVVIEDSATGARAAGAAGMRCFGYCADTLAEKLHGVCEQTFASMNDLPALLR